MQRDSFTYFFTFFTFSVIFKDAAAIIVLLFNAKKFIPVNFDGHTLG
jgi:hypothetical protein